MWEVAGCGSFGGEGLIAGGMYSVCDGSKDPPSFILSDDESDISSGSPTEAMSQLSLLSTNKGNTDEQSENQRVR